MKPEFIKHDGFELPIPDSPHFTCYDDGIADELDFYYRSFTVCKDDFNDEDRLVIGSVAEAYWRDKAEDRAKEAIPFMNFLIEGNENKFNQIMTVSKRCQNYSNVWRDWRRKGAEGC